MLPPLIDFQEFTPPQIISFLLVGETPQAISYQPCPPTPEPDVLQSKIFGVEDIKVNVTPPSTERYTPPNPLSEDLLHKI